MREDFESLSGWTLTGSGTGYSATIDQENYKVGNSSIKLTTPSTSGYVRITKPVNWDLSAPESQGNFRFWVYVYGTSAPADFQVLMSNDLTYANYFATYYYAPYKFQYRPGWNLVNLRTSDWLVGSGTPSWSKPIVSIRIRINGTSTASYSLDGLESGVTSVPAVVLTFDDGHSTLYSQAYTYMEPKNVRGTGYINSSTVATVDRATWPQLEEIYAAGWTIGNHTANHTNLSTLSLSGQIAELAGARDALNAHGMTSVNYVAYPWGNYNADTLTAMANLDMRSGRTILAYNNVSPLTNPYILGQRGIGTTTTLDAAKGYVDTAISRGEILILTLHDISDNPTASGWYIDRYRAFVDYLISKGVPVITMDDLYKLQSRAITIPRAVGGSCWFTSSQTEYSLSYTAGVGGTLMGVVSQTVSYGGDGTPITAVADTGYHFENWSDGSTANPRTDTNVTANVAVTATFSQNTYTLTVNSAHGPVTKNPDATSYAYNTPVTLTMGAVEAGWTFTGWEGGGCTGTAPCTVSITADTTVTANFSQSTYTLTVVSDHGVVSKEPDQPTYAYGTQVLITMGTVESGWTFTGWEGGGCAGMDPCTVTIIGNIRVTTAFTQDTYNLTITQTTGGTITVDSEGPFHYGDPVTLTAMAEPGYTFTGWTGDLSGTENPVTISMIGDRAVSAAFTQDTYSLTINQVIGGTITANSEGPFHYGDKVILTATAEPGYTFTDWTGAASGTTNPIEIMMDGDKSVSATFTQNTYTLTVISDHGIVNKDPDQTSFTYGQTVVVTIGTVESGWTFTGWSGGGCAGTDPCTVVMNADTTVTAAFTQIVYNLVIETAVGGTITAAPAGPYHYGDVVTVEAKADTGYTFTGWTGDLSGTTNPTTINMTSDKTVSATFEQNLVSLTITQSTGGMITADPAGPYHYGDEVTLTAAASTGYTFTGWTDDLSGTTSPVTITLDGDKTVGATFALNVVTLSITQSTGGMITAVPAGPYHYGDEVTLTAAASTGYTFTGWTDDLSGTTSPVTITLDGDKTVGATFALNGVTLSITQSTGGMITADPAGPYHYGDEVTLTATADSGYSFTGWTDDLSGTTTPTTITLDGDKTVGATFALNGVTLSITQSTGGMITADPAGPYHYGDEVTLTATADSGYSFTGWTGDASGTTTQTTITLDGDKTVGATFALNGVTLSITQSTGGMITADPAGPYHYGDEVTLTATADSGYSFTGWTGDASGTTTPTTITLDGDKTVGATFALNGVTLSITQSTGGMITAVPAGPYHYGDEVTLTAAASTGYTFTGWTDDLSGTTSPVTITLDGDKTVGATFALNGVTLSITQSTGGMITADPAGPYHYGDEVTLTATADSGYSFTGWTGDA